MATNRDLLKEAIADAKAVKEAAIANAKVALEEAFTPYLKEKFAAKLAEIEEMEDMEEGAEMENEGYGEDTMEERLGTINDPSEEGVGNAFSDEPHGNLEEEDTMDEELDLEALLRELEDETNEGMDKEEMTEAKEEGEDEGEGEGEEEVSLEDMTEDELRDLIEDVIAGMVEAGELEGNIEGEEGEEEMEMGGEEEMMDEVDIDELMAEAKKEKMMKSKGREEIEEAKKKAAKAEMDKKKAEKELQEAYATLEEIQASLQEVKLLNAKLLYTNKIFRAKNLTESQKVKVLESFDKATSVKEAKLVYETLNEGLKTKKPVNESIVRGLASKAVGSVETKKPIFEVDSQFARWQVLAGIKNND